MTFDGPTEEKSLVDDVGCPSSLDFRWMLKQRVDTVKVRIDHNRSTASKIDVLFPPIRHIVS